MDTKGLKVALGIAIALFVGTAIYTGSLYTEKTANEKKLNANAVALKEEKANVLSELTAMSEKYDFALSETTVANQNLVEAKARIEKLIKSVQVSENNLKSLWKYKKMYLDLQDEMTSLLDINDQLKVENQSLASSLDNTKQELAQSSKFVDSLFVQNKSLANVVESAAVLNTNNLVVSGVIERNSGKQIPTERSRRSDKIRICYTVAKNKLVEAGDKELFVQVIDPKNNILGVNKQVKFGEDYLAYSLISKFNYENESLPICEYVSKVGKTNFEKGTYKVNVFNGSEKVSSSQFALR